MKKKLPRRQTAAQRELEQQERALAFIFYCHLCQQLRRLEGRICADAAAVFIWSYAYGKFQAFHRRTFVQALAPVLAREDAERVLDQLTDLLFLRPGRAEGMYAWAKWRVDYAKTEPGESLVRAMFADDAAAVQASMAAFEAQVASAAEAIAAFWASPDPAVTPAAPKLRLVGPAD